MYFPCYFLQLSLRDVSLNPISGHVLLECCSELLNMFYKWAQPKIPATHPHSVRRLRNGRKPIKRLEQRRIQTKKNSIVSQSRYWNRGMWFIPLEMSTKYLQALLQHLTHFWVHPSPCCAFDTFIPDTHTLEQQIKTPTAWVTWLMQLPARCQGNSPSSIPKWCYGIDSHTSGWISWHFAFWKSLASSTRPAH